MFEGLDLGILDNPEYKEDAVREDIIMPILKRLGYSSTGVNTIRRGIPLTHPFVHIGSTQRKINIIPDYILETQNGYKWILDAKAPNEDIIKSGNVEQAYSYAINPEIRCEIYGLCNGRHLTVFHISEINPLLIIDVKQIEENWNEVAQVLSPRYLEKPSLKEFLPDFGMHLLKAGADKTTTLHFVPAWINSISKVNNNDFTFFSALNFGDEKYGASFDFDKSQYEMFLDALPKEKRRAIDVALQHAPFMLHYRTKEDAFGVIVEAKMGEHFYSNENETYIPFEVVGFETSVDDIN
ncbi:MAG: type I restriction enzyme HsdR N-terminal domain-containing protein [Flavobacteriales bacterium]|nr:type I restriction enzyme HsdR N-terminal domain-containing protein [Flavobacteriales bacterium]